MGGQDESRGEYIRERKFLEKGIQAEKYQKKGRGRTRTLKEESEQCIILCISGLLGRTCIKAFTYIFYRIKSFFLILILGRGPFLLFDPFSYKFIDLGQS